MKINILLVLLGAFLVTSCKTTQISIQVLNPAQISLPSDIKTIAFVNRSLLGKKERFKNIVEGAITGESVFADRLGSEECIKGVVEGLNNSPRIRGIIPANIDIRGTGSRQFPDPLNWETVDSICKANNVEALACLEVFDSDCTSKITSRAATKKEKNKDISYTEFTVHLDVNVVSGWRIYYPAGQKIIDQNTYIDTKSWANKSDDPKSAEKGLPYKDDAVSQSGNFAGNQYAFRISSNWSWVSRIYYSKENSDFEQAKRMVKSNDWKGAAILWQKYINSANPKISGYACYNLALAAEMDGNLESAIDWAKKAYVGFKNKSAYTYMNILQKRLNDQYRLDEQMKRVE